MQMQGEYRVLVVDDEAGTRESLSKVLAKEGYDVAAASDGREALNVVEKGGINVVLADVKMPRMDGVELLRAVKRYSPDIEVILITGYGTVETAVEAMREGAYDFVLKPFRRVVITKAVSKAIENQILVIENRALRDQLHAFQEGKRLIGSGPAMARVVEIVEQVAPSAATVLMLGESGTGKEVVANAIHQLSPRRDRRFIKVSCAALPETLLEAELFGHERGAFTGAVARREGRFEAADGGTLFLDEIGEMSLATQVKLLRVLQEGEFERLGSTRTLKADVRLIAATNEDLLEAIGHGSFRADVYYRLNVITITVPPLRERKEDIPLFVDHFIHIYSKKNDKKIEGISAEAMSMLTHYDWPGNVRELENAIERAVVLTRRKFIGPQDLPVDIRHPGDVTVAEEIAPAETETGQVVRIPIGVPLRVIEMHVIDETLRATDYNRNRAAEILGLSARTIYRRLKSKEKSPVVGKMLLGRQDLPRDITSRDGGGDRMLHIPIGMPLREVEKRVIDETLRATNGNRNRAAEILGLSARTIYRRVKETEKDGGDSRGMSGTVPKGEDY